MTNHQSPQQEGKERIHDLNIMIAERKLIIYVIESDYADNKNMLPNQYKRCMKDEIRNHKDAVREYKKEIKTLQP